MLCKQYKLPARVVESFTFFPAWLASILVSTHVPAYAYYDRTSTIQNQEKSCFSEAVTNQNLKLTQYKNFLVHHKSMKACIDCLIQQLCTLQT